MAHGRARRTQRVQGCDLPAIRRCNDLGVGTISDGCDTEPVLAAVTPQVPRLETESLPLDHRGHLSTRMLGLSRTQMFPVDVLDESSHEPWTSNHTVFFRHLSRRTPAPWE